MEQEHEVSEKSAQGSAESVAESKPEPGEVVSIWKKYWWAPVAALVLIGGGVVYASLSREEGEEQNSTPTPVATAENQQTTAPSPSPSSQAAELLWQQGDGGWVARGSVPTCADPMELTPPVDISKATSILYPGQTRGQYKPHGGFRFDNATTSAMNVQAPMDGYIVRGARYTEMGEPQFLLDIMSNCGVMSRFDHIRVVPTEIEALMKDWPSPQDGDTRTYSVNPPYAVSTGDIVGTAIGFNSTKNFGMDWGVYDFRKENEASKTTSYRTTYASVQELAFHAVCWFDWLSAADETTVRALPAGDSKAGKSSDYCK